MMKKNATRKLFSILTGLLFIAIFCFMSQSTKANAQGTELSAVNLSIQLDNDSTLLSWTTLPEAEGYYIYKSSTGLDDSYTLEHTVYSGSTSEWTDYYQDFGTTVSYYVVAYRYSDFDYTLIKSPASNIVSIRIPYPCIYNIAAKSIDYKSIKITWNTSNYGDGYVITRSTTEAGPYETIATIADRTVNSYTDSNLDTGTTYFYKVYSYNFVNGVIVLNAEPEKIVSAQPLLAKAVISSKTYKPTKMKVTWKNVEGANGFIIYLCKPAENTYRQFKTIAGTNASQRSFTLKVSNGKCYKVKIVAYRTIYGINQPGKESIGYCYADYYGYEQEDGYHKYTRIYGKSGHEYKSKKQAQKNMKTIKVKVWDFKKGMHGKKITKIKYVTCNKNIAPTLKKIFDRIYHGKEKAPIYEIGGFSWRSGQHGQGLAIDLNSNYNAMYDSKKAVVGKCWNPKKYAYSIKRNGDIEKAFAEFGFPRGFWGSRKDYMHFSYFGV